MLLLITTNTAQHVSWWIQSIGKEGNVTREQLEKWHLEKERKPSEVITPLTILGLAEIGLGLGGGILGSEKLKVPSFLIGAKGLALAIGGWVNTYNLISEARRKAANEQKQAPPVEDKPPQITEKIIEHHHHYHDLPETDREALLEPEIGSGARLRIHPEEGDGLSGEDVRALIEEPVSEGLATCDQKSIKESLRELQLLEEKFDIERILSIVRKVLKKCPQRQYANISEEAYLEIFEIGKNLDIKVLSKAIEDKDLKRWAMLCLIAKGTEDADRVLIEAIKQQENMKIMISFIGNENVEQLTARITEILKKAAA